MSVYVTAHDKFYWAVLQMTSAKAKRPTLFELVRLSLYYCWSCDL